MVSAYKKSKIGLIPIDWEIKAFDEIFDRLANNTLSRDQLNYGNGLVKDIHYGDVLIQYPEVLNCQRGDIPFINSVVPVSGQLLKNGDIVIADTAEDETVGKATEIFNPQCIKVVAGLHTIACRPLQGIFVSGWLGYFINSHFYHDQLLPYIHGTKVSSVSRESLKNTYILVPPYKEQQKIVNALSDIDALIAKSRQLVQKCQALKQACLQHMFPRDGQTEPDVRLPGFTGSWEQRKLGNVAEIGDVDHRMPASVCDGIPYLMTGNFTGENELDFSGAKQISEEDYESLAKKIKPEKGDILFARYASVGATRYVGTQRKFMISYSCAIIKKSEKINSRYLHYYLTSPVAQRQIELEINAGSQSNIGIDSMKNDILVSMSSKKEQEQIAEFFKAIDDIITLHQRTCQKYQAIKQGMMEELLTGKTRLI